MARDPRYDILFEPVQIGSVTACNLFHQVPHCNGMGHPMPSAVATMRCVPASSNQVFRDNGPGAVRLIPIAADGFDKQRVSVTMPFTEE